MVGGRKDESLVINSTNVFAALGSFKKKKKSTQKESGSSKSKAKTDEKDKQKEVFWAPTPLTVKSWADVDDEDDDDYYATTAPPQSVWAAAESDDKKETQEQEPAVEVPILYFIPYFNSCVFFQVGFYLMHSLLLFLMVI